MVVLEAVASLIVLVAQAIFTILLAITIAYSVVMAFVGLVGLIRWLAEGDAILKLVTSIFGGVVAVLGLVALPAAGLVMLLFLDKCTPGGRYRGDMTWEEMERAADAEEEEDDPEAEETASTFGGYPCTTSCSGHVAGFRWAAKRKPSNPFDCYDGVSKSFQEGCSTWMKQPLRDPSRDDQGRPIPLR